jgi:hypothetical protein
MSINNNQSMISQRGTLGLSEIGSQAAVGENNQSMKNGDF